MPLDRPVVFPLLPIVNGACACAKGAACSRVGKHPALPWKDVEAGSQVPKPEPGAGYGIKTGAYPRGSGVIVVDIDSEEGLHNLLALAAAGDGLPDTYSVRTGRGLQLYFEHPDFYVRNSAGSLARGLDIRGDGGFVVGPGSPHGSGAVYEVVDDRKPAALPEWLRTWLKQQPAPAEVQPHPEDVAGAERERRREIYGNWLAAEAPICRAGQGGDQTLFKVVQRGAYDLALPTEDVLELISEVYDPRCEPPWGAELEDRVLHKANDAKTKSTRPRDMPLTAAEEIDLALFLEPTTLNPPAEKPTAENDYGFKVQWGGWDSKPVPPKYLVDNLLVEQKVSMIFAEPGTIKSWTAIDLAACVSQGLPWLGERATVQGPVLYVDFEDGKYEFHRRVDLLVGREDRPNLGYVYAPGNIVEQDWWIRLEKFVLDKGVKFVVIDTLAGATPGVDENDRNAADPLTYAGRLTETAKVTVLFLHHANRAGDIRGTSAFKATVDTLFKLESVEEDEDEGRHRAKLTCVKSGQKKVHPVYLELTDDGLCKYEPVKGAEDEKGDKEDKRSLAELQREILLLIESDGPFSSVDMIRTLVKARTTNVSAVLAELTASGQVYRSPEGWRRDTDGFRRQRLKAAIGDRPTWGRAALIKLAAVPKEFFERCQAEKRIRQATAGTDEDGYVWIDSVS